MRVQSTRLVTVLLPRVGVSRLSRIAPARVSSEGRRRSRVGRRGVGRGPGSNGEKSPEEERPIETKAKVPP